MILLIGIFTSIITAKSFDLALTTVIISIGISYGLYFISSLISAFLVMLILQSEHNMLMTFISIIIQFFLVTLLFRIKRLSYGIPFLLYKSTGALGLIISGLILIAFIFIGDEATDDYQVVYLLAGGIFCVVGLILWWRRGLTSLYRKRIKERNINEHEKIITEKDEEIRKLKENNDFMSKLIHRDNKLLPSMYEAVKILFNNDSDNQKEESKKILDHIDHLMNERKGLIIQNRLEANHLPTTKDNLIDGTMIFMYEKAREREIDFKLIVNESIEKLTEIITSLKLETLIADLIENAIIATKENDNKKILVTIDKSEGFYVLSIQDSGIPFERDTLENLGLKKSSTHLDNGGSGIGYMTIFEILCETKACLIITEYNPIQQGFTKSVSVRFDNKSRFIFESGGVRKQKILL